MDLKKLGKYAGGLAFCTLYRLLRIFPNNDPIMGFALPYARKNKWWQALLFPVLAMVSFDIITMRVGVWTIGTAGTYGLLGLLFWKYFQTKKRVGLKTYAGASIVGVLIFDLITGPIMSSAMFGMPFAIAFVGQIPFTMAHLASATGFTVLVAPVLDPQLRASLQETFYSNIRKTANAVSTIVKAMR